MPQNDNGDEKSSYLSGYETSQALDNPNHYTDSENENNGGEIESEPDKLNAQKQVGDYEPSQEQEKPETLDTENDSEQSGGQKPSQEQEQPETLDTENGASRAAVKSRHKSRDSPKRSIRKTTASKATVKSRHKSRNSPKRSIRKTAASRATVKSRHKSRNSPKRSIRKTTASRAAVKSRLRKKMRKTICSPAVTARHQIPRRTTAVQNQTKWIITIQKTMLRTAEPLRFRSPMMCPSNQAE